MEENMKLTMNPNFIGVVKSNPERTTLGGIVLTGTTDNDLCMCEVIHDCGEESKYGIGNLVLISPQKMIRTKVTGYEFYVVKVEDVWGTFNKE